MYVIYFLSTTIRRPVLYIKSPKNNGLSPNLVTSASYKTAFVPIPIKAVTDAFTCMPKKSAPHIDGWTWELFRDLVNRPKTAELLRYFVELFVNGKLPKPLWKFLSTAIMIPFHKLAQIERDALEDPRLRPINHHWSVALPLLSARSPKDEEDMHCRSPAFAQPAFIRDTGRCSDGHPGMHGRVEVQPGLVPPPNRLCKCPH